MQRSRVMCHSTERLFYLSHPGGFRSDSPSQNDIRYDTRLYQSQQKSEPPFRVYIFDY